MTTYTHDGITVTRSEDGCLYFTPTLVRVADRHPSTYRRAES